MREERRWRYTYIYIRPAFFGVLPERCEEAKRGRRVVEFF